MTRSCRRLVGVLCLSTAMVAACSADEAAPPDVELGELASQGRDVARDNGCTSCHSVDGRDGVGPTWADLYGSQVELADGRTVTADEEYLVTAIQEPDAQIREGYRAVMPERPLPQDELDAVLEYLRALGGNGG